MNGQRRKSDFCRQLVAARKAGAASGAYPVALAPLAGITETVYRQLCRRMGADLVVTELVSARGIRFDPDLMKQRRYLRVSLEERPVLLQLFGYDAQDLEIAIGRVLSHPQFSDFSGIDLNFGCPVAKVVKTGAGSALMRDPSKAEALVRAAVRAAEPFGKPVSVKLRSGWSKDRINAVEVAQRCEAAGASMLTIHARTRDQMYSGQADWSVIRAVRQAVQVVVFGNGDVVQPSDGERMVAETGADGVMIGRAAIGNPWLFRRFRDPDFAGPDHIERAAVMEAHLTGLMAHLPERTAVVELRKQLAGYLRGLPDSSALRRELMTIQTAADWIRCLRAGLGLPAPDS